MNRSITNRQKRLFGLIVRNFIEDGEPIGSSKLVKQYGLDVSSATVRNDMVALSELGLLTQLHTSAGRIPTERGFRYFVQQLVTDFELPYRDRQMIRHQFHQARVDLDQWLKLSAAVLANISHGASFVTAPRPRFNLFKHVQLISTKGRLVLMVLVLSGGQISQQMLTLASPMSQPQLSAAAERLNFQFVGKNLEQIQAGFSRLNGLEQDIARLAMDVLRQAGSRTITRIYRNGLSNILDDDGTRKAVRLLEERTVLATVVDGVLRSDRPGVQVVIGGEGRWEELKDCTLVLSRYGVDEELEGEIAVIGSTRMPYGRIISAVRYVADMMTDFVQDYYVDEAEPKLN